MRSIVYVHLVLAAISFFSDPQAAGQDGVSPSVVVMDQATAELLRSSFPAATFEVVVRSDDEPYDTLNRRALAVCDATQVFYRSDQSSLVSRFFRERIFNQGVDCFDLADHFRTRARGRGSNIRAPGGLAGGGRGSLAAVLSADSQPPTEPDSRSLLSWASSLER